ncbi:MAG: O-antigen ligase family protein [Aggregatilineales bacterium]
MRSQRLAFIFLAFYLTFIGGSAYYVLVFPIRFFHHGFLTVLAAWWLYRRFRNGKGIPFTPLNTAIYASIGVWFLTAITSLDPRMSIENVWFLILHVLMFFVIVDLFQRGRQKLVLEAQFLMGAVVVFITTLEIASWYFGLGLTPGTNIGWISERIIPLTSIRVALAMNISTLLAGYVAPLITLTIAWALTARRKDYRQVLWILSVLLIGVLILTFSRGGLLSLLTALGAFSVMRFSQQARFQKILAPKFILAGASIVGIIGVVLFVILSLSGSRNTGDEGRLDMYRSAVEITRDYPIMGVGVGEFGRAFREYRTPEIARDKLASAHNYYLNTASETGILGILVNLWLGILLLRTWWQRWQEADSPARKLRLEAVYAALLGIAVHSMVDVFTTTPVVLVILVLLAYSITGHKTVLDTPPAGQRLPTLLFLAIVLAYGVFFFQTDRAYLHYQFSIIRDGEEALEHANGARNLDPHLHLYDLQIAYLTGEKALNAEGDVQTAIAMYEDALELEPTWDIGWLNLAALTLLEGDTEQAIEYVTHAYEINPLTQSPYQLARIRDGTELISAEQITMLYRQGIGNLAGIRGYLATAPFWTESPLRTQALYADIALRRIDQQYRILRQHDPEAAYGLVPQNPQSAADWWVVGEYALTVDNDPVAAFESFTEAIGRSSRYGDYYASRARAAIALNSLDQAQSDLNMAELLGTFSEYPDAIRANLTNDPAQEILLLQNALPSRFVPQEFSAVLYGGRFSQFDIPSQMRYPGPGREVMQSLYELAEIYLEARDTTQAIATYRTIIDYAPDEIEAREQLALLSP